MYGHDDPVVGYSDDPIKDKWHFYTAFPCLSKGLTPMTIAHGLEVLELPTTLKIAFLGTAIHVEAALSSLMAPIDDNPDLFSGPMLYMA